MPEFSSKIEFFGEVHNLLKTARDKNISAFGLQFGERTVLAAALYKRLRQSRNAEKNAAVSGAVVYICADAFAAKRAYGQISALCGNTVLLPEPDDTLTYRTSLSPENYAARLAALTFIAQNPDCMVVTSVAAVASLFPDPARLKNAILRLQKGQEYDPLAIASRLNESGYRRESAAVGGGQFSLRGDILDIFPPDRHDGIRLEFFGDTLESIKTFDPFDLTGKDEFSVATIVPNTEVFYDDAEADVILRCALKELPKPKTEAESEGYHKLVSHITTDLETGSRDMRLSFLQQILPHTDFSTFVNPSHVIFDDAREVYDNLGMVYTEHENRYKAALLRGEVLTSAAARMVQQGTALRFVCPLLAFHARDGQNRIFVPDALFHFRSTAITPYHRDFSALYRDLSGWLSSDFHVLLCAGSEPVRQNLLAFLANCPPIDSGGKGGFEVCAEALPESAVFFDEKLIVIGTSALVPAVGKKVVRRGRRDAFLEPAVGAYVVHQYHGIGFCEAVTRLSVGGAERDYAVIRYAGGDTLYVPVENMDSLSRYGEGEEEPKLSKIGGAEFARVKERVRASVKKMAFDLTELYAQRSQTSGHRYNVNNELLDEFCAAFPYSETEDQLTAAAECIRDLTDGKVMDRLLCGDVGYGKTEVALRAAFKVVAEGKQVAFLSPTTILARQHYNTVQNRMEPFGVNAVSLTRFDAQKDIQKSLESIQSGKADIVCGTHRLLSADVKFRDLGLLILDEEQRFGVADKEKIKKLKYNVNVLTLSATPIPRTLHLSLTGIRDISLLDTPPAERLPVKTYVAEYTEGLLADAVMREVGRGGQVFVVYNRVASIDRFAVSVQNLLGDGVRVAVAHGQMGGDRLENIIADFSAGAFDVLIASAIIENGIDMPNANTMIVVDSDRFGLSQLYQLRGRVGRSNRLAYVYFTYDARKVLTENAYKRLDAITQFTEFGSGFKIAMRDLEIRGAGNILGREQHGHIERVGYETYYKILAEVVGELQGGEVKTDLPDLKVVTDFHAFLPDHYLSDKDLRVRVYARIAAIASLEEKKRLAAELTDIYGVIPAPADNLMLIALVKNLAVKMGAESATLKKTECALKFRKTSDIPQSISQFPGAKIKAVEAVVSFGGDRMSFLKWLTGGASGA